MGGVYTGRCFFMLLGKDGDGMTFGVPKVVYLNWPACLYPA